MTSPTIALIYAPTASDRHPWTITVDGVDAYRVADADHAAAALQAAPDLLADGWTAHQAVRRALDDARALVMDEWTTVGDDQ